MGQFALPPARKGLAAGLGGIQLERHCMSFYRKSPYPASRDRHESAYPRLMAGKEPWEYPSDPEPRIRVTRGKRVIPAPGQAFIADGYTCEYLHKFGIYLWLVYWLPAVMFECTPILFGYPTQIGHAFLIAKTRGS